MPAQTTLNVRDLAVEIAAISHLRDHSPLVGIRFRMPGEETPIPLILTGSVDELANLVGEVGLCLSEAREEIRLEEREMSL